MIQETERKQKKKFAEVFKENLQKLTIALVSIIYITQGIFELSKKNTTLVDIIGSIGLSVSVGIILSSSFVSLGLKDGKKSEKMEHSLIAYAQTKVKATPNFDKLSAWCEYKNSQELMYRKKEIIQESGLNWKAYKFGYYEEHQERLNETQKQALEFAKNCSVPKLSSQELLSDLPHIKTGRMAILKNKRDAHLSKFGQTEKEYQNKSNIQDIFTKLFIAIVCGLYGLSPLVTGDNISEVLAGVLWNTMQIVMWLAFGLTKYVNAKSFIEDEYRQTHIVQKTEYLNEFIATMENNPNVISEFDEDLEIDKYILEYISKKESEMNEQQNVKEAVLD